MPSHRYVEESGLAATLAAKRLAGVTQELNLVTCVCLPEVQNGIICGLTKRTFVRHCFQRKLTVYTVIVLHLSRR